MDSNLELKPEQEKTEEAAEADTAETEPCDSDSSARMKKQGIRMCIAVILIVVVIFAVISAAAEFLGAALGKGAELALLSVIALILAAMLIKDKKKK